MTTQIGMSYSRTLRQVAPILTSYQTETNVSSLCLQLISNICQELPLPFFPLDQYWLTVKAPVSKVLVGTSLLNYLLVNFPLQHYKHLFVYNPHLILQEGQIWRLLFTKLVFLDLKDVLIGSLIFYYLRIFERRFGSRKYCSYLIGSGLVATLLELLVVLGCKRLNLDVGVMPSGPLCFLYPLYIPYFCDIPRVALTHMWGIPVTGKSFTYILGLQIASGTVESGVLAFCGCMAGILYRVNFFKVKNLVRVPEVFAQICDRTLGRVLVTPSPRLPSNMGATIEIQRQQQLEQLEQQLRRNQPWPMNIGRPQPRNPVNGPGIFGEGGGNLRHRFDTGQNGAVGGSENGAGGDMGEASVDSGRASPNPFGDGPSHTAEPPAESQIEMLVEMGFSREKVLQALHISNNDLNQASNILLQDT